MERRELGTNRDGWFYTGRLWYEQEQEEPGPLSTDGEGEEHEQGGPRFAQCRVEQHEPLGLDVRELAALARGVLREHHHLQHVG